MSTQEHPIGAEPPQEPTPQAVAPPVAPAPTADTAEPQAVAPAPPADTAEPQAATPAPLAGAAEPQAVAPAPPAVVAEPQAVAPLPTAAEPSEPATSLVGTTVAGRYKVERLLGQGGMGAVYLVYHTGIRKRMALKVLRADVMRNPAVLARFEREAMAAAHFDHPNVAAAHDYGRLDEGSFFLVLEYVEGQELRAALEQEKGPLPLGRALFIARQLASALVRAHELGIVHRESSAPSTNSGQSFQEHPPAMDPRWKQLGGVRPVSPCAASPRTRLCRRAASGRRPSWDTSDRPAGR